VLAAIGAIESDHGRSTAPGVRSGVNAFGCCAGPMQFNLTNGPPSTWQTYRVDGNHDGDIDPYDPADAIASAARYLRVLLDGARSDIARAVFGYNHSPAYVEDVLARARAFGAQSEAALLAPATADCAADPAVATGPANLRVAERRELPRAYATLPAWAMAAGRPAQPIDARLLDNALWILRTYRLRVTAAREGGHNTHGDGTALDLVPAEALDQAAWDASAGALARDLAWTPTCGHSGTRPACQLVPAIQFIGYEATATTAHRAPAAAPAPRTCTSPGSRRALAPALRQRPASGSRRSRRMPRIAAMTTELASTHEGWLTACLGDHPRPRRPSMRAVP
jgi:transglycosylase-like protein with SLT domain